MCQNVSHGSDVIHGSSNERNSHKPELSITILAVALQVLSDGNGLWSLESVLQIRPCGSGQRWR